MPDFSYPASDYDRPQTLLSLLGTHWDSVYGGRDQVQSLVGRLGQMEAQTHLDLLETVATLSRFQTPIFHRENWSLLVLRESELNLLPLLYGADGEYDGQFRYGRPRSAVDYAFPLPAELVDIPLLLDRPAGSQLLWHQGVDYVLDLAAQRIRFRVNPLDSPQLASRPVYTGDTIVDREVALWIFRGQFDWQHLYTHWGYVLQLQAASSEAYRTLLNTVFDALAQGTSRQGLEAAFSALTGIVLCQEAGQVTLVQRDSRQLVIATEQRAYRYRREATPLVAVGEEVVAGQALVDSLQFFSLTDGQVPPQIDALTLESGWLGEGYLGGLTFENTDVPLVVEDADGWTKVSFALGGFAADAEAFWDTVHARGVAADQTLAHLLDQRAEPTGEPTAAHLPATINPLGFLIENVLRYQTLLVKIRVADVSVPVDVANARILRKIIPPWLAVIVIYELEVRDDPITMNGPGSSTAPGYQESAGLELGLNLAQETISAGDFVQESVRLSQVDGFCE